MSDTDTAKKKQRLHLDRRLKTVADMVRLDKRIVDIGTDHALVPCYLAMRGAKGVIATDISDGPLACARASAELYGITDITLIKCSGLDKVPPVDDVIIAGMGGEMIADIVSRCSFLNGDIRFILQPMTKDWVLRRELYGNGLEILGEKTAAVSGKVYTVMLCAYTGVKREIDGELAFLGKNSDELYLEKVLNRLEKMGRGEPEYLGLKKKLEAKKQQKGNRVK
ncbi:MAG: class I SAM-dependent methyltransferase [Bacteroides sp.]|nr:class I SAM-dependent methyltransferase [Bacteroides sp.]